MTHIERDIVAALVSAHEAGRRGEPIDAEKYIAIAQGIGVRARESHIEERSLPEAIGDTVKTFHRMNGAIRKFTGQVGDGSGNLARARGAGRDRGEK